MQDGKRYVLVVDDDEDCRVLSVDLLESEGYAVRAVASVNEALKVATRSKPALVILDLDMPGKSGQDFLRIRARRRHLAAIPVLIVSAHIDGQRPFEGTIGALSKPADLRVLLDAVDRCVRGAVPTTTSPRSATMRARASANN